MNWSDYVYVSETGHTALRWKIDIKDSRGHQTKARKDGVAGGGKFRYLVQVNGKQEQCSRVVYKIIFGDIPDGMIIDHKDGNALNNNPCNLELKTLEKNNRNIRKTDRNKSGKVGVYFIYNRNGTEYVEAFRYNRGKKIARRFSTAKYGKDIAFNMAVGVRNKAIEEMNKNLEAGYTERHGY